MLPGSHAHFCTCCCLLMMSWNKETDECPVLLMQKYVKKIKTKTQIQKLELVASLAPLCTLGNRLWWLATALVVTSFFYELV